MHGLLQVVPLLDVQARKLALLVFEKPIRAFLVELRKFDKALSQWLGLSPLPHQQRVWVDADFMRDLLGGKSRIKPRVSKIRSRLCHLPYQFSVAVDIHTTSFLFAVNRKLLEN